MQRMICVTICLELKYNTALLKRCTVRYRAAEDEIDDSSFTKQDNVEIQSPGCLPATGHHSKQGLYFMFTKFVDNL